MTNALDVELLGGDQVLVGDERKRGLVRQVDALAGDHPVQGGDPGDRLPTPRRPAFLADRSRWASASLSAARARKRGLPTCWPSEVVTNDAIPRSTPTIAPVGSSDTAGTSSQDISPEDDSPLRRI
jgi:hypothetical protein